MQYENPVSVSDVCYPDAVRAGEDFYMAAASFGRAPGIPVFHSKNLVEWELINYVIPEIPFDRFKNAHRSGGAGAPSIRYRDGKFYCLIPFSEEGIFVSETDDPYGKWSLLRPLLVGKGYKDPCPLWANGKCYVSFSFGKDTGSGDKIAVFETDAELKTPAEKYAYVYDGSDNNPQIFCPKFYKIGDFYYILVSAGGAKAGWQTALRSEKIYGPYKSKVILIQGGTDVNGPCGGVLVGLDGERYAMLHMQDRGAYGKALHLQPVRFVGGWPVPGKPQSGTLGEPCSSGEYPADIQTGYRISCDDEFDGDRLNIKWQTPANPRGEWYSFKNGLKLNCAYYGKQALAYLPQIFMQSVPYSNFSVKCKCRLNLVNDGDEAGFTVFGDEYSYICVVRSEGRNYLEIRKGAADGEEDETLCRSQPYDDNYVTFQITARYEERNRLAVKYTFGGSAFTRKFYAAPLGESGAKLGIYARSASLSKGFAVFKFFRVSRTDNRVNK